MTGNIGSSSRQEYTIIGEVVNLAFRLEQVNKQYGSRLLVSEAVREALGNDLNGAVPLDPVRVKGSPTPLQVYQLA